MQSETKKSGNFGLALAAIGIVFGDIGTSPIYAISETLKSPGLTNSSECIFGIISFIFWSLTLVIGVKYLFFITRAHNQGEGGIFAILSLFQSSDKLKSRNALILATTLGIMSAALLFADSLITPALSIMSAIEGMNDIYPNAEEWVVPVSIAIILALYAIQSHGTKALSLLFSPVMICWFIAIAAFGLLQVIVTPKILFALSPIYAWKLISLLSLTQILTLLGSILLAGGLFLRIACC
jgi:KUP system potassium uptake protein